MLLSLLLCVLGGGPDFTLHVECGPTNSSRHVTLPAWPPGTTGVHLRVDHDTRLRFGYETDGDGLSSWEVDAWISAGWSLRSGTQRLASARLSQFVHAGGACVPWDGLTDYGGYSGGSVRILRETSREVDVTLAQIEAGLHIDTSARSAWSITITSPWGSFGSLYWLNQCESAADFEGTWIP